MPIPRWKTALSAALENHPKSTVIQLSSIDSSAPLPHVRSHIFRQFVIPEGKQSLPLLLTSTDLRTPKVTQMLANPNVEAAWWMEETKKQWRIAGSVSIIPGVDHELHKQFLAQFDDPSHTRKKTFSGMEALYDQSFDWEKQRLESFKAMSRHMKASWCRPPPGTKLKEDANKWPTVVEDPEEFDGSEKEKEENKKNWDTALGNFALLIIDPIEVDYLDMDVVPNRRWRNWKAGPEWDEEEIVP